MNPKQYGSVVVLIVITVGVVFWPRVLPAPGVESTAVGTEPVVDVVGANLRQEESVAWALSRYRAAGLELPSLTVVFHDDYESCGMREGVLRISGDEIVVHECESDPARSRRSLLHELAHAWDRFGPLEDDVRREFLAMRGLGAWSDHELKWSQRGEEQAAEIIAWGLMHLPAPIPTSVGADGDQAPDLLADAFMLLTGRPPPFEPPA